METEITFEETSCNTVYKSNIQGVQGYTENHNELEQIYMGKMSYYSITLDLISLYLKCQKLLYTESKSFCESLLYALMLPAIFISSVCTVLNVPLKNESYGPTVISSLNGFNSFLLAVVTYLKLDAKAEAHKTSSYQFDKLQTLCEFYSGKTQMLPDDKIEDNIKAYIEDIQKKVGEIKDANQFTIPEVIRYRYNNIYSYNIFAMMKKHKTKRSLHIQRLIDVTNVIKRRETNKQKYKPEICSNCNETVVNISDISSFPVNYRKLFGFFKNKQVKKDFDIYDPYVSLEELYRQRDLYIKDIIEYRNMTIEMNEDYNNETEQWIKRRQWFCCIFNWLKT